MSIAAHLPKIHQMNSPIWITTSRIDMWLGLLGRLNSSERAFHNFLEAHGTQGEITLARRSVREIFAQDPSEGVIATIIWSHERGIRVNALSLLVRDMPTLVTLMSIADFGYQELNELLALPGISVPTASKMLSATGKTFCGLPAAIIDDTIIQVIENTSFAGDFPNVAKLRHKSRSRPVPYYEAYLRDISDICEKHNLSPDLMDRYLAEHALDDMTSEIKLASA